MHFYIGSYEDALDDKFHKNRQKTKSSYQSTKKSEETNQVLQRRQVVKKVV